MRPSPQPNGSSWYGRSLSPLKEGKGRCLTYHCHRRRCEIRVALIEQYTLHCGRSDFSIQVPRRHSA
jgi:hypothetical protein